MSFTPASALNKSDVLRYGDNTYYRKQSELDHYLFTVDGGNGVSVVTSLRKKQNNPYAPLKSLLPIQQFKGIRHLSEYDYAIYEDFMQKDGVPQNPYMSTYLIPGVYDIPDRVHSVILEYPDPNGPWGARGMAEMPYIPLAPAVTAAVHDALGIWFDEFPLTPERVLRGLGRLK